MVTLWWPYCLPPGPYCFCAGPAAFFAAFPLPGGLPFPGAATPLSAVTLTTISPANTAATASRKREMFRCIILLARRSESVSRRRSPAETYGLPLKYEQERSDCKEQRGTCDDESVRDARRRRPLRQNRRAAGETGHGDRGHLPIPVDACVDEEGDVCARGDRADTGRRSDGGGRRGQQRDQEQRKPEWPQFDQ